MQRIKIVEYEIQFNFEKNLNGHLHNGWRIFDIRERKNPEGKEWWYITLVKETEEKPVKPKTLPDSRNCAQRKTIKRGSTPHNPNIVDVTVCMPCAEHSCFANFGTDLCRHHYRPIKGF
jgi:hypothetical protein